MVVSIANWFPPQGGKPFAMTSIRRLSMRWTVGMLRSEIRVCVATLAPASLQTRAAAHSKGCLGFEVPLISGMLHGGRQEGIKRDGTDRHVQ